MTEFKFERKKENIDDYIKTSLFTNNLAHKILIAALALCLLTVAVFGVVLFVSVKGEISGYSTYKRLENIWLLRRDSVPDVKIGIADAFVGILGIM